MRFEKEKRYSYVKNSIVHPPIILACGLSGSGKTFNSGRILRHLQGYAYLNPEYVRKELGIKGYSRKDTPRVLAKIIEDVEALVGEGRGVIIDANLKTNDTRQMLYDTAHALQVPLIIVEFVASDKDARARISQREDLKGATNHPKDPAIFDRQKVFWRDIALDFTLPENECLSWIRFDSSKEEVSVMRIGPETTEFVDKVARILAEKSV